eukprot:COSAG02_NODE_4895_length_4852_cov_1.863244_2_plen_963_part_01
MLTNAIRAMAEEEEPLPDNPDAFEAFVDHPVGRYVVDLAQRVAYPAAEMVGDSAEDSEKDELEENDEDGAVGHNVGDDEPVFELIKPPGVLGQSSGAVSSPTVIPEGKKEVATPPPKASNPSPLESGLDASAEPERTRTYQNVPERTEDGFEVSSARAGSAEDQGELEAEEMALAAEEAALAAEEAALERQDISHGHIASKHERDQGQLLAPQTGLDDVARNMQHDKDGDSATSWSRPTSASRDGTGNTLTADEAAERATLVQTNDTVETEIASAPKLEQAETVTLQKQLELDDEKPTIARMAESAREPVKEVEKVKGVVPAVPRSKQALVVKAKRSYGNTTARARAKARPLAQAVHVHIQVEEDKLSGKGIEHSIPAQTSNGSLTRAVSPPDPPARIPARRAVSPPLPESFRSHHTPQSSERTSPGVGADSVRSPTLSTLGTEPSPERRRIKALANAARAELRAGSAERQKHELQLEAGTPKVLTQMRQKHDQIETETTATELTPTVAGRAVASVQDASKENPEGQHGRALPASEVVGLKEQLKQLKKLQASYQSENAQLQVLLSLEAGTKPLAGLEVAEPKEKMKKLDGLQASHLADKVQTLLLQETKALSTLESASTPQATTRLAPLNERRSSNAARSETSAPVRHSVATDPAVAEPAPALLTDGGDVLSTDTSDAEEELPPPLPSARVQVSVASAHGASAHTCAASLTQMQTPIAEADLRVAETREALTPAAVMAAADVLSLDLVAGSAEAVAAEQAGTRAIANLRYMEIGRAYAQAVLPKFGAPQNVPQSPPRTSPRTPPRTSPHERMVLSQASVSEASVSATSDAVVEAAEISHKRAPTTPLRSTSAIPSSQFSHASPQRQKRGAAVSPPRTTAPHSNWAERLSRTPLQGSQMNPQATRPQPSASLKGRRREKLQAGNHPTSPTRPSQRRFRDAAMRASSPNRLRHINAQLLAAKIP